MLKYLLIVRSYFIWYLKPNGLTLWCDITYGNAFVMNLNEKIWIVFSKLLILHAMWNTMAAHQLTKLNTRARESNVDHRKVRLFNSIF